MVYQGTNRPREDDEQAIASLVSFQPRAGSAKMPQLQMPLPFDHPGEAAPALQETSTYPDSQSDDDDAGEEARASKRRNMMNVDERRQLLESDAWCARVEPKRVLCLGCKRWLKLDQRSLYFSGLWLKHRDKCAAIKRLKGEAVIQVLWLLYCGISEVPASVPRRIVNDWPNFGDRILVRDQLQNQIAGGYDATGSYYAQTGLMGPGVPYARPSTINSGRHEPSRALTPYDEDDFLYEAEIYDEEHYYQNGVFAPAEIPGECPTTPCHHRYRFSTRHELDAYFDGTIIEAIAVNAPPVDPDVMNGARCLTLLAARIRQRG